MTLSKTQFALLFAAAAVFSITAAIFVCKHVAVENVEDDEPPEPSAPPLTSLKRSKSTGDL
jgi:hypothetical protein